jgi:sulfite reductase alpha subunit-like flavoprotein
MTYQPGDSFGICCPNPDHLVDFVIERLQQANPDANLTLDSVLLENSEKENPVGRTLRELLTYRFVWINS